MMRGLNTTVRQIRRKVFEEVARLGFQSNDETLNDDMEAIPYAIVNEDSKVKYRESVHVRLCVSVCGLQWDFLCGRKTVRYI